MYRLLAVLGIALFLSFPVKAAENTDDLSTLVEYDRGMRGEINFQELTPEEDDLYDGAEIKPLEKELSATEKQQRTSTDVEFIEKEDELPDLPCTNPGLKKQVEAFIFNNIKEESSNSVLEKRSRVLLVKNMHDFSEISEAELQKEKNFKASAAAAYLKINKKSSITHICSSQNNDFDEFKDIFVIVYPYANYYKVIVTNLIPTPETMDEATFIYNWE